jgi:hypothetical protein
VAPALQSAGCCGGRRFAREELSMNTAEFISVSSYIVARHSTCRLGSGNKPLITENARTTTPEITG